MDIISGLTAAKLAVDLAKDLREIDRSVDEAAFKLKLADLTSALADAQVALSDAKLSINAKDEQIAGLEAKIDVLSNGEICPMCRKGRLQLEEVQKNHQYGAAHFGVEWHHYVCDYDECGHSERRLHDPVGAMKELAKKKR